MWNEVKQIGADMAQLLESVDNVVESHFSPTNAHSASPHLFEDTSQPLSKLQANYAAVMAQVPYGPSATPYGKQQIMNQPIRLGRSMTIP